MSTVPCETCARAFFRLQDALDKSRSVLEGERENSRRLRRERNDIRDLLAVERAVKKDARRAARERARKGKR